MSFVSRSDSIIFIVEEHTNSKITDNPHRNMLFLTVMGKSYVSCRVLSSGIERIKILSRIMFLSFLVLNLRP